ncbi:MAG: hypothetical protein A2166_01965 [Omnitrophica WOR_2 bacterium RBG_13_41_10]|nr:MAG: hypothetical protein A2166_01965 [Omnitrophica WOR_2 bacterium RBG_13_41_10]
MSNNKKYLGSFLFFLILAFTFAINALADTFDLSYDLTEGGYRLELNPANLYKGVNITINSTVTTRYQVVQKVITPLENRDNPAVVIRDNFVIRGLRGTNRYGDLRVPSDDAPVRFDDILYISDVQGHADSFTIVYGLNQIENIAAGNYFGRVSFTLIPIDSTRTSVTKILDIYITVSPKETLGPSIEIIPQSGLNYLKLSSKTKEEATFDVQININRQPDTLFSIVQVINRPLESVDGSQIDYKTVNIATNPAKKGTGLSPSPLSYQQQAIYTSKPTGEAEASLLVTYSLGDLSGQKAGNYKSMLQYYIEQADKPFSFLKSLELEIEIAPIFDIAITPQDEKGTLEFKDLKPQGPPKTNEVLISIKTNIGKQYQVSQNIYSDLTDKEGNTIPNSYFSMRSESMDTKGKLQLLVKSEVKKGDTNLFISDEDGSTDSFKVIYELVYPPEIKAGDYSTRITYSLSEI